MLSTDNGGQYISELPEELQNETAERLNGTVAVTKKSIVFDAILPQTFMQKQCQPQHI